MPTLESIPPSPTEESMSRALGRYRELLFEAPPPSVAEIRVLQESLSEDGTWPNIDYASEHRSGWEPRNHLANIRTLSYAYSSPDHPLSGDQELYRDLQKALNHWLDHRYESTNWWHNQIGTPGVMRDISILLGEGMDPVQREEVIAIIGQYQNPGPDTGANLVWRMDLAIQHGLLRRDADQVRQASERCWEEVEVGAPEGIQDDWSFLQHGPRLQTFQYGETFAQSIAVLAWQLRGTPWEMPPDRAGILSNYLLEGMQWMLRGQATVPSTMDRASSRKNSLTRDLRPELFLWREVEPHRSDEIDAFIARQNGAGEPLSGFRHFNRADFSVNQRPAGSFFLKTVSTRTLLTESINQENLKGRRYMNCGTLYVLRNGREYEGLQPVWQWKYLPGITVPRKNASGDLIRRPFAGGLGDGESGLVAMDYEWSMVRKTQLQIRKSWFFHRDTMVALLSDWTEMDSDSLSPITSLDQCRLQGEVLVGTDGSSTRVLGNGSHPLQSDDWLLHNGIGYFPGEGGANVSVGPVEGTWNSINRQYSDETVVEPVLKILKEHGTEPRPTHYAIVMGADPDQMNRISANPDWDILRNDRRVQSVIFDNDLLMAAFFEPDSIETNNGSVEVDRPCLLLASGEDLWLCDPSQQGIAVTVTRNGKPQTVSLPDSGEAVQIEATSQP